MKNDACNGTTNWDIYLKNEANPDTTIFSGTSPVPAAADAVATASTIIPDAHIPPSGQNQHTNQFSQVNMKNIDKKEKLTTLLHPTLPLPLLSTLLPDTLAWKSPTPQIHW